MNPHTCDTLCILFDVPDRHLFSIIIPLSKLLDPGYPVRPITVGEHIRKKRMDLGLLQREVAEIIGVTESSIWNWEHGTEPELQYKSSIIIFLGYIRPKVARRSSLMIRDFREYQR